MLWHPVGLGFCGVLLWSFAAVPGEAGPDPAPLVTEAGRAWQVKRPNVDLGKGLEWEAGAAVCRAAGQGGSGRGVCVRLPADWAVVESERRGILARYFVGVFWASAAAGSGMSQAGP